MKRKNITPLLAFYIAQEEAEKAKKAQKKKEQNIRTRNWRLNNPEKVAGYRRAAKQRKDAARAENPRVFKTSLHQRMQRRKSYHKCKLRYLQTLMTI